MHVVKFLIRIPWGPLLLKNTAFGGYFQNFQNSDMYVYLVVFYGSELENKCLMLKTTLLANF